MANIFPLFGSNKTERSVSMNPIQTFTYQSSTVRTVERDGEPWFVLKDVCDVLGISKYRDVSERLDPDERGSVRVDTPGGPQTMTRSTNPASIPSSSARTSPRPSRSANGSRPKSFRPSAAQAAIRKSNSPPPNSFSRRRACWSSRSAASPRWNSQRSRRERGLPSSPPPPPPARIPGRTRPDTPSARCARSIR